MNISDEIVAAVGVATCITMLVASWAGQKAFEAIFSKKEPNPTPEKSADIQNKLTMKRGRSAALSLILIEGIVILVLSWRELSHHPPDFKMILQIGFGVSAIQFAILGYFIVHIIDILEDHIGLSKGLLDELGDHWDVLKMLASEIDKKAYSRKRPLRSQDEPPQTSN